MDGRQIGRLRDGEIDVETEMDMQGEMEESKNDRCMLGRDVER